jgi:hypothetical protein
MTEPTQQSEIVEVHNAWTIYGTEANGKEARQPLAMHGRVQAWGDPRWFYHRFDFVWLSAPDGKQYINHAHCWTDLKREPGEYANLFAPLIAQILMPGTPPELCGRDYLHEDDFWQEEWGPQPPFYDDPYYSEDDWGDDDPLAPYLDDPCPKCGSLLLYVGADDGRLHCAQCGRIESGEVGGEDDL